LQLHTFPEGKVHQDDAPIRRLKWGTASLIVRAPITPIVLPIVHHGFHEVTCSIPLSSNTFGVLGLPYISFVALALLIDLVCYSKRV